MALNAELDNIWLKNSNHFIRMRVIVTIFAIGLTGHEMIIVTITSNIIRTYSEPPRNNFACMERI